MDDDRIINRYLLREKIGQGAMGQVYRAEDLRLGSIVAVKLLAQTLKSPEMCDRFALEARACAQLNSDFIVNVTDYGVDKQDIPFYVMEYLEGQNLKDLMQGQPLPLARFFNLSQQICLGLQCAHQGIRFGSSDRRYPVIHCDIKPSNIWVVPDPLIGERVKILDFGIAKVMTGKAETVRFGGVTPQYGSPEQMEGGQELDPRSDIYSFGIVMFEMITGQLPLHPRTSTSLDWFRAHRDQVPAKFSAVSPNLDLPDALEVLVLSCLEKLPQNRPDSVEEILQSLRTIGQPYGSYLPIHSAAPVTQPLWVDREATMAKLLDANPLPLFPKEISLERVLVKPLLIKQETLAIVGKVLPEGLIRRLQIHQLYNVIQPVFLHIPYSYPLLLWQTVVYTSGFKFLWIPYYFDLKKGEDLKLVRLLCQKERYQLMLFDREQPHWCSYSIAIKIMPERRLELQQWAIAAQSQVTVGSPPASKKLLEVEFQRLQPMIEQQLRDRKP
jgi:serine/threonine-protein kinase